MNAAFERSLQEERIGARKAWGRYVDLMLLLRREQARQLDHRLSVLRQRIAG